MNLKPSMIGGFVSGTCVGSKKLMLVVRIHLAAPNGGGTVLRVERGRGKFHAVVVSKGSI